MALVNVNITELRAVIIVKWPKIKRIIRLEDSPHYQYLLGNKQPYIDYLKIAHQPDHSVEKYQQLINEFQIEKANFIRCYPVNEKWVIADGFHRACILLHRGISQINIEI